MFSDKDDKPSVPSPASSQSSFSRDVKEPTSLFQKSRGLSPLIVVWPEGDHSNWLTLLRYPCQKLAKAHK